jgi:hypothetical protein
MIKVLIFFLPFYSHAEASKIDLLWKARGLQAVERSKTLARAEARKEGALSQDKICEMALEDMFKNFANPKLNELQRFSNDRVEIFKMSFLDPKQEGPDGLTVISVGYNSKATSPDIVVAQSLAVGWGFGFHVSGKVFSVTGMGCDFAFPIDDPLSGKGKVRKTN